jgi:hypothetical protein
MATTNSFCDSLRTSIASLFNGVANVVTPVPKYSDDIYILNQSSWTPALTLYGTVDNGGIPLDYTNSSNKSMNPVNPYGMLPYTTTVGASSYNNIVYSVDGTELFGVVKIKFSDAKYTSATVSTSGVVQDAGLPLFGQFLLSNGKYFRIFNVPKTDKNTNVSTNYICITQSKFPEVMGSTNGYNLTESWLPSSDSKLVKVNVDTETNATTTFASLKGAGPTSLKQTFPGVADPTTIKF